MPVRGKDTKGCVFATQHASQSCKTYVMKALQRLESHITCFLGHVAIELVCKRGGGGGAFEPMEKRKPTYHINKLCNFPYKCAGLCNCMVHARFCVLYHGKGLVWQGFGQDAGQRKGYRQQQTPTLLPPYLRMKLVCRSSTMKRPFGLVGVGGKELLDGVQETTRRLSPYLMVGHKMFQVLNCSFMK